MSSATRWRCVGLIALGVFHACSSGTIESASDGDGSASADSARGADGGANPDATLGGDAATPADASTGPSSDAGTAADAGPEPDARRDPTDGRAPTPDAPTPPVGTPHGAAFVSQTIPARLEAGRRVALQVTMQNTGEAAWSRAAGFHLGSAEPMDDLTWGTNRAALDEGAEVRTGDAYTFNFTVTAPAAPGVYGMRWQMLQEGVEWFGDPTPAVQVEVALAAPPVQGAFDLAQVEIVGSPDLRDWPVTSQITSIGFRPDNFHIDHALRGQWPPVVINPDDGTEQEATVWVFFYIGDHWYGTGGERLRPGQADKQLTNASDLGPGWLYDANRWGAMTNYIPQPGELVGFMVAAGSSRSDANFAVMERTAVVLIPFPRDGEDVTFSPPFAGGE